MKKYAIIVAGGKGLRMGTDMPKQFLEICGIPIIFHTINAFINYSKEINIILVISKENIKLWENICKKYNYVFNGKIVFGGKERFDSVKNGLNIVENDSIVAIHDSVRPLVSKNTIEKCFKEAEKKGNAIPCIKLIDSIREVIKDNNKSVNRENYRIIQTPQIFYSKIIKKAFEQKYKDYFTDDASVLENAGYKINIVEGNRENIKITTPFDMTIAECILKCSK